MENTQPAADVAAQEANVSSSEADTTAAEAGLKVADENIHTMEAGLEHDKADLERMKADFDRAQELFNEKLLARQDFELKKFTYEAQKAQITQSAARIVQARAEREQSAAQLASYQRHIAQARAGLTRASDVLRKYDSFAPLDGVVTNLPMRVGESVVTGIQNSEGSTIMTIADMSIITAEVKVDETDIVSVHLGQPADITIDAIPNKTFKGHVTEIGDTAILRSTGLAASQSAISSQEAKDFKVVIAMDNPPDEVRPGLSCTAKITTATRTERGDHSHSGAHHPAARRPGATQTRLYFHRAGRHQAGSRRRKSAQGRNPGRLRRECRQSRVPQSRHRHHRRHRH